MFDPEVLQQAQTYIRVNEACRLVPYQCTAGKITIGWGRNLSDNGISEWEAGMLFQADYSNAMADCIAIWPEFPTFPDDAQIALLDMAYNLGHTRLRRFRKLIRAVKRGKWHEAAQEIENSKYFEQVTERATSNRNKVRFCR